MQIILCTLMTYAFRRWHWNLWMIGHADYTLYIDDLINGQPGSYVAEIWTAVPGPCCIEQVDFRLCTCVMTPASVGLTRVLNLSPPPFVL